MTIRLILLLVVALSFSACAGKSFDDFRVSVGFLSPYDAAVAEYKQGKMMEARTRLRSISKDHEDYKKARSFLKRQVEPARLKLLRYYARKGKKEEKQGHWAQASEAYATAASLSIKPKALLDYKKKADLQVRILRASTLYQKRKEVDETWLQWSGDYLPPKGLLGDDEAFVAARDNITASMNLWMLKTWELAEKYKTMDMPELAWVYADSYLRLDPDSKNARDLRNAMATAMPRGFKPAKSVGKSTPRVSKSLKSTPQGKSEASIAHVKQLMAQQRWAEAKREAQTLRIQGDTKADKLLESIQEKIAELAEKAYLDGNLAFRLERIDKAVEFWAEAVRWMPHEQIYLDSLRRGEQIQERLSALKSDESSSEKVDEVNEAEEVEE